MRKSILLLVLAMVLGACGGGGDDGGGGNGDSDGNGGGESGDRSVDVCALLSTDEAEQWLGAPVEAGPSNAPGGEDTTCSFRNDEASMQILVQVHDGEQYFAFPGSGARGPDDVAGLGEDAHSDGDSISFLKNEFAVSVAQIQGPITIEQIEEIARLIEPRIPG